MFEFDQYEPKDYVPETADERNERIKQWNRVSRVTVWGTVLLVGVTAIAAPPLPLLVLPIAVGFSGGVWATTIDRRLEIVRWDLSIRQGKTDPFDERTNTDDRLRTTPADD